MTSESPRPVPVYQAFGVLICGRCYSATRGAWVGDERTGHFECGYCHSWLDAAHSVHFCELVAAYELLTERQEATA